MAELLKVREITIDTMQHKDFATKEEELKVMRFYQNDLNSAKLLITVTHDKVVTDFSTATKVQIAFLKPDGKRVFQDVQNVNQMQGKYYVVLSTQTLIAYGNVVAQLRLTFPDNKVIETCKFVFAVDESIMSDEAMKSTNEFPVIQKAIEAGKKLEGVDINGIIAAGVKAEGAVKKSGDTMTGDLLIENSTKVSSLRLKSGDYTSGWQQRQDGLLRLIDWKKNAAVMEYNPTTDQVIFRTDTNLVKKSGDTLTGNLRMDKSPASGSSWRSISWDLENSEAIRMGLNGSNYFVLWDAPQNVIPFEYRPTTKEVRLGSGATVNVVGDSNLVKKTGDTMSGDLNIQKGIPGMNFTIADGSKTARLLYNAGPNIDYGFHIMTPTGKAYLRTTGETATREIATKEKDGQANLTLTADATNWDTSFTPVAIRRGNTVTVRCALKRNAGSASAVMTNIPIDMRPTTAMVQGLTATDGSYVRLSISTSGDLSLSVADKNVYVQCTYVVD